MPTFLNMHVNSNTIFLSQLQRSISRRSTSIATHGLTVEALPLELLQ